MGRSIYKIPICKILRRKDKKSSLENTTCSKSAKVFTLETKTLFSMMRQRIALPHPNMRFPKLLVRNRDLHTRDRERYHTDVKFTTPKSTQLFVARYRSTSGKLVYSKPKPIMDG